GTQEMSASAEEVSTSAQKVSHAIEEQSASMQEVNAAAAELSTTAMRLQELVGQFKLEHEAPANLQALQMAPAAEKRADNERRLKDIKAGDPDRIPRFYVLSSPLIVSHRA